MSAGNPLSSLVVRVAVPEPFGTWKPRKPSARSKTSNLSTCQGASMSIQWRGGRHIREVTNKSTPETPRPGTHQKHTKNKKPTSFCGEQAWPWLMFGHGSCLAMAHVGCPTSWPRQLPISSASPGLTVDFPLLPRLLGGFFGKMVNPSKVLRVWFPTKNGSGQLLQRALPRFLPGSLDGSGRS